MVRATLLEPQPPMMEQHIPWPERLMTGLLRARDVQPVASTLAEQMGSLALGRAIVTEHGIPYRPRGPGERSRRSSRGHHTPPGRSGEPVTGRRATG